MTYQEFINKASSITIYHSQEDNTYYLHPMYRYILYINDMYISSIDDYPDVTIEQIYQALNLQVNMLNSKTDKTKIITDMIYNAIVNIVQPQQQKQNTQMFKLFYQFIKNKNQLIQKQKQLQNKQKKIEQKQNVKFLIPGINFSKKKS